MRRKRLVIVALLLMGGVVLGCIAFCGLSIRPGYIEADKQATVKAIEQFHARMNSDQFDEIYSDAHAGFQNSASHPEVIAALQKAREQFGSYGSVTHSTVNVIIRAPVQVRAVYNTSCEKGDVTELFTFVKESNQVKLAHYQVFAGTVKPK